MKKVHYAGLIIVIVGFMAWLASFFVPYYSLDTQVLQGQYRNEQGEPDHEKIAVFEQQASGLMNESHATSLSFVRALTSALDAANESIKARYQPSDATLEQILNAYEYPAKFDLKKSLVKLDSQAKKEKFEEFGSWLDGRQYETREDLKANLMTVRENIGKYGLNDLGFSTSKENLFAMTKASEKGPISSRPGLWLILTYGLIIIGAMLYLLPRLKLQHPGIKNDGVFLSALKNRGWLGILLGAFLIVFYIMLYFMPQYMTGWVTMVDPVSQLLKGEDAGAFFLYGFIYTLAIMVMGVRMILKYRHNKYQIVRTLSVTFFQLSFAFLIPEILIRLNRPYYDFKNIWPLNYSFFFDSNLNTLIDNGTLGIFMLGWGIALVIVAVPVITYFLGKRWYCSWVCGCGGLAETLGDPYRQLSDKSMKAWKIERWMIHSVLVFAVLMTAGTLYTFFSGSATILGVNTYTFRSVYGAWIGAGFAGVVGTGFYPLMGNRVWCRFGCPLAAYLGIVQRFKSRFRITTNGGQCISCGNCSTYCEMGIDVRWYAQRGQNIVRSSCVGCGVCSAVCPRGVLNLENRNEEGRLAQPVLIGNDSIKVHA